MSAGSGVQHSEFNPSKHEALRLLQIWILPDTKGVKPRYAEEIFAAAGRRANCIWSPARPAATARLEIHQDADLWLGKLEAGQSVGHALAKNRHAWVHVAEGEVNLNGEKLSGGDAAAVSGESKLQLSANKPSQVLLFDLN